MPNSRRFQRSRSQPAGTWTELCRRCAIALLLVLVPADLGSTSSAKAADAVSGASRRIEPAPPLKPGHPSLTDQALLEKIINGGGVAHILATTNDDGTPHAEVIEPRYAADRHLRVSLGPGRTRSNIDRDARAFLTVYPISNCPNEPPSMGVRLVVERRPENKPRQGQGDTKGLRTLTLEIKTILPLS